MNDYLKAAIPASIALIGTIITIYIGYRQWKRQQDTSRYGGFVTDKQSAYKSLWEQLEDVHVKLRTEEVDESTFHRLVCDVNSFVLKSSLYLDKDIMAMSNRYLQAIYKLKTVLSETDDEPATQDMRQEFILTSPGIRDVAITAGEIRLALQEVEGLRDSIIERCRKVIGGH